ncbi:hypothetical protein H8959_010692 [Pygathrix nigripes]
MPYLPAPTQKPRPQQPPPRRLAPSTRARPQQPAPPLRVNIAASRAVGCEDPSRWASILERHREVLRARADPRVRLEALDRWYREDLPAAIRGRAENHVTELERLLAWKLARGRFRPRLQQLVTTNPPELVVHCSTTTFCSLPDVGATVTELSALCGDQESEPELVLMGCLAASPRFSQQSWWLELEMEAFMSDEAVVTVAGLLAPQYTLRYYLLYPGQVQERATALSQVETALWTWAVGQRLCPDLLPNLGPSLATHEDTRPAKKRGTQAE